MELSNEDKLRLNVLLAQDLKALRINEATMTIHALTNQGEAKVALHPTLADDQYLRMVRELISLKITGSPGGYPIFLKSWTRMGHTDNTVEHMLLLGEPEAVVAAVYAPKLSHELGVRAWWANSSNEVAIRLMEYPEIVKGELGKEIGAYLMEFLPYEEKQLNIVDMVRLCLQDNVITDDEREKLWIRAKRRNPFCVGFLHANPKQLPFPLEASKQHDEIKQQLASLIADKNPFAIALLELLSSDGQKWLQTLKLALKKPVDQDVVISLFIAVGKHFDLPIATLANDKRGTRSIELALEHSQNICENPDSHALTAVISALNTEQISLIDALLVLAQMGEHTLIPIFSGNESVGVVMRKRLLPLTTPLLERVDILMC